MHRTLCTFQTFLCWPRFVTFSSNCGFAEAENENRSYRIHLRLGQTQKPIGSESRYRLWAKCRDRSRKQIENKGMVFSASRQSRTRLLLSCQAHRSELVSLLFLWTAYTRCCHLERRLSMHYKQRRRMKKTTECRASRMRGAGLEMLLNVIERQRCERSTASLENKMPLLFVLMAIRGRGLSYDLLLKPCAFGP